jgi:hypothetical protein
MAALVRRLSAILAADVVGYSRLMGTDEEGTLAALKKVRTEITDPQITRHNGRIVKTTGDGLFVEFSSMVDALRCAVEIQKCLTSSRDRRRSGLCPRIGSSTTAASTRSGRTPASRRCWRSSSVVPSQGIHDGSGWPLVGRIDYFWSPFWAVRPAPSTARYTSPTSFTGSGGNAS